MHDRPGFFSKLGGAIEIVPGDCFENFIDQNRKDAQFVPLPAKDSLTFFE
jgi:hypothetical protein